MRHVAARRIDGRTVLAASVLLLAVVLTCNAAFAQSEARGGSLYAVLGCDAGNCHGVNPLENLRSVLNGAGSPSTIEFASVTRTEMNHLYATFISDQTAAQDIAAWLQATVSTAPPPPVAPTGPTTTVVEYVHAGFGHYFVTGIAGEIAALDAGQVAGWARTGKTFKAYVGAEAGLAIVCRFFTVAFAPKSSHFYTPLATECAGLRSDSAPWQYEGDAFYVPLVDSAGACPAGTKPVFRLYNNGQGGAPNHRYTNDTSVRTTMMASGWVPEGFGAQGVAFCAPD
jgi:hypothetical protein